MFQKTVLGILAGVFAASPCSTRWSWLIEWDNPFCPVHKTAALIEHADVQEGMTVLDAGCGPGRVTLPLAYKVGVEGEVVAMDIQSGMLLIAQEKAEAEHLTNIRFLQAGLGENQLEKEKFDRALLVCVLGEIPDQEAALQEIFDALKPGGILSVTEIIFDPDFHRSCTVRRLAQAVGFHEKEMFGNYFAFTLNLEKPTGCPIRKEETR